MLYQSLKALHLLGVILFIGNIVITGWWKVMADRTRDPRVVAFAQRQVTLTDWVFTAGGSLLVGATGTANAVIHGISIADTYWLRQGILWFAVSGLIWIAVLIPLQIRLAALARAFGDGPIPERYWQLSRHWLVWGAVATAIPLGNLYRMVFKPLE